MEKSAWAKPTNSYPLQVESLRHDLTVPYGRQLTSGQGVPRFVGERHARNEHNMLVQRRDPEAACLEWRALETFAPQDMESWRCHRSIALSSTVAVDEKIVAIAVEEIRRTELPNLLSKLADNTKPGLEDREGRTKPRCLQTREQRAKSILGVGLANRLESSKRKGSRVQDAGYMAIVGEEVGASTEFAGVRLGILQRKLTRRCPSDMADGQSAFDRMILQEAHPRTCAGAIGVLDDASIAILDKSNSPPVLMRSCKAAMPGKRLERKCDRCRHAA